MAATPSDADRADPAWPPWAAVRAHTATGLLLALVVLAGVGVAMREPNADSDYFATVSQIIGTLFIAVVLEAFTYERVLWADNTDRYLILALLGIALFGLFACVRGLLGLGGPLPTGAAAAGLTAAALLVALALFRRLGSAEERPPAILLLLFMGPAMFALVIL